MKCRMTNSECRMARPDKLGRFYSFVILHSSFVIFFLSGCVTAPKSVPPSPPNLSPQAAPTPALAPAPVAAPETKTPAPPPKPPPAPPRVAAPLAVVSTPTPPKDEFVMAIDSQPAGAVIVVNGIPIGKAPLQLKVKTTPQGFFRDYMTVRARFLATSSDETSITVEDDCTPREKIPDKLIFTPQGAHRHQQEPAEKGN
jgi:hypothetical protein